MKILGIDSSGLVASAAYVDGDNLIAEFTVNNKQTHSQTLLPMIDQVVQMSGIELSEIDAIAIAAGPGSFTGLRIGSATAKGFGLALHKPIVSVPTLDGLAYRLAESDGLICPIMDARRGQVYTGVYRMKDGMLECVKEQSAIPVEELLDNLSERQEFVHFLGDGVPIYQEKIKEILSDNCDFAPAHLSRQSAAAVAVLGQVYYQQGKIESAAEHKPFYLRQSQAERESAERLKNAD